MSKGYPTPDNPVGDIEFTCIPVLIPSNPEFEGIFAAAIYGLYAEMSKDYFWRQSGTMSQQQAAFIASRGLALTDAYATCGGDMSCEEFADCIEDNETVQAALVQNLTTIEMTNQLTTIINENGFGNPNSINSSQTTVVDRNPSGALQEEIKELENCNLDKLWAGIREGIVARLNDVTKDLMEDLIVISDVAERLIVFIDTVPVIGDLVEGLAYNIAEIIPDIYSLYESYESTETLDELACEIFEIVCAECRYPTFTEVFEVYAGHTLIGVDMNNLTLDEVANKILDLLTEAPEVAFFTMSVQALFVLNLQAAFNGANGTRSIVRWAELGEDSANDNWLDLCDACGESYMKYIWDFKVSSQDSYVTQNFSAIGGAWISGTGWVETAISGSAAFLSLGIAFDPTWKIRAVGVKTTEPASGNLGIALRPTRGLSTGQSTLALSWGTTGWTFFKNGLASSTGYKEVAMSMNYAPSADAAIEAVCVIFETGFHKPGSIPSATETLSATVYP